MAKIAFFDIESWQKEYISKKLKGNTLYFSTGKLTKASAKKIKDYDCVSAFIYSKIDKSILDELPKLKLISTMSTGFNHIDLEECKKRKINVCNVPTYGENTVAEHTFALILSLSRKIPESTNKVKIGHFDLKGLRGFDLKGKTIGIIGMGNIGKHVARMAHGFGMKIISFDLFKDMKFAKKYDIKFKSLNQVIKNCDILTLHAPLNKHTFHMINKSNIKLMKKGSLLINTARGSLIDTEAIIYALRNKILAGAGLDVLEDESFIPNEDVLLSDKLLKSKEKELRLLLEEHILTERDNVIITPHNAFNSEEALTRIIDTTVQNIKCFINKRCINKVKC